MATAVQAYSTLPGSLIGKLHLSWMSIQLYKATSDQVDLGRDGGVIHNVIRKHLCILSGLGCSTYLLHRAPMNERSKNSKLSHSFSPTTTSL